MKKFITISAILALLSGMIAIFGIGLHSNINGVSVIDPSDTAWVSVCAVLVMLMTPALGFFYGGLVRQKNLLSVLVQCLVIFSLVSAVWALWAYSLAFGPSIGGVIGNLSNFALQNVGVAPGPYAPTIPSLLFFFFQLKFAAITPALIIGAFAERIKFKSLLLFTILWATVIYAPAAHWVWGNGGWLRALGVLDFAGGTVVHMLAGFSALAAAIVIGGRKEKLEKPNNIPFVILGASLLWFGWFGFNAGSSLAANGIAVNALVVTNIAAAFAALSWMSVEWYAKGKPTATGVAIGAVCGLVAITPASGYVDVTASMAIGIMAGVFSNLVANLRIRRTTLDDTLDVFACHGIGGVWGALATGIFANAAINSAGTNGLLYGNAAQFLVQVLSVIVIAIWAFFGSFALLKLTDAVFGLRVSEEAEKEGLDKSQHGECAYCAE